MIENLQSYSFDIFYSKADNPLHNFYIPALSQSIQYDRSAGYFSSAGLAIAAAGVARLIQNEGRMRLLVGADLSEQDIEAIERGYDLQQKITERLLERFPDPEDALLKKRLEVMAWMVAEGSLEIRVVLPTDENGLPIPANLAQDYYHPKSGVFTDADGNQVAFSGSVNESFQAWMNNYEELNVFTSWAGGNEPERIGNIKRRFENLWVGKDPHWIALDIPRAVIERLVKFRPKRAPTRDPLEATEVKKPLKTEKRAYALEDISQEERIVFQFVKDAPFLPNAIELGAVTSALTPWPHQSQVANTVISRFPERAMLSDEVGLGKTIEAGLVIRQLWLSGRIKRCLILAPKSVLKQWQEELYEKFGLDVPRYDAGYFWCYSGESYPIETENPWDAHDLMLVGSQLAKRVDRREQFLNAKPWDLLVVDEAHHARRKDFLQPIYRPNRLLGFLNDLKDRDLFVGLLLMTATPMQVHPIEVWDLLLLLGMGGRWGASEEYFLDFFKELRQSFNLTDWESVYNLVSDYLATSGTIKETIKLQIINELGRVKWAEFEDLVSDTKEGQRKRIVKQMGKSAQPYVREFARHHTPVDHFIFRSTRDLLREYQKKGILKAKIPEREPERVRVKMEPAEIKLYDRIDEYITHFYQKYEDERRGLGFVMTVYRRRLTSSFYAVRRSLERRLEYLRGEITWEDVYAEDDTEQDELDLDLSLESEEGKLSEVDRKRFEEEIHYVEDFLGELRNLSINDSKLERLKDDLRKAFRKRNTVLVFTQYTDTMDFLRDQLVEVYGSEVACYSGRGGETWNGISWAYDSKENVKNRFRDEEIRILICTESASEGLNLQTCGILINYDMPWNPMKVEQRIGRIDRIGQYFDKVWIWNYFYRDTIEDQIYERLSVRINWFETVVGKLQPILTQVGQLTRDLAMLSIDQREIELEKRIVELQEQLRNLEVEAFNLDDFQEEADYETGPEPPISLRDLEEIFTNSKATSHFFEPHPNITGAFNLKWKENILPVTFSPKCFDEHPTSVRFLTYGSLLFQDLIGEISAPEDGEETFGLVRVCAMGELEVSSWYEIRDGKAQVVDSLKALKIILKRGSSIDSNNIGIGEIEDMFGKEVNKIVKSQKEVILHRREAARLMARAKAQRLLLKAAMVELALGQRPELFEEEIHPKYFNEEAVRGLARKGYPWAPLVKLAFTPELRPQEDDGFYLRIVNNSKESLRSIFVSLRGEAGGLVKQMTQAKENGHINDKKEGIDITLSSSFL